MYVKLQGTLQIAIERCLVQHFECQKDDLYVGLSMILTDVGSTRGISFQIFFIICGTNQHSTISTSFYVILKIV